MAYQNFQNYPNYNPYLTQVYQRLDMATPNVLPHYEIVHVNGRQGAESLPMDINSRVIAMDDSAPLVWLITNDNGVKKATALTISENTNASMSLEDRVKKLEEMINEQSNSKHSEPATE